MALPYIESPQTEYDQTRLAEKSMVGPEFSEVQSFASPSKGARDNLMNQMRGQRNVPSTPSHRNPLATLRQGPAKNEFTPLLKSATKQAYKARLKEDDPQYGLRFNGGLTTPAAMKPGFRLGNSPLPEPSEMFDQPSSSELAHNSTSLSMPPVASSSAVSTPMALPRRGQEGVLDGGNVLTLREQEAKLEQIDKENFGLKLKIHYLEEGLKKSGPEHMQNTIRENSQLKADAATLQLDLKKNRRSLKQAELELEQYRRQLQEYTEKVKRRHMDEELREEMDELRRLSEERVGEIEQLKERLEGASSEDTVQQLRDDLADVEAELRDRDQQLDEREDELARLQEKLQSAGADSEEALEKDRRLQEQEDRIADLEADMRALEREKDEASDNVEQKIEQALQQKDVEIDQLNEKLDTAEDDAQRRIAELEEQLKVFDREKDLEIRALQRQVQAAERDKQDELDALTDRLKLAESQGDNQAQLAQQAAQEAREQARQIAREKGLEIEGLQARLDVAETASDALDSLRGQLKQCLERETESQRTEARLNDRIQSLTQDLSNREKDLVTLKAVNAERSIAIKEAEELQGLLQERARELHASQQRISHLEAKTTELEQLRPTLNDKRRELETMRMTLQERSSELEALREHADVPDSQLEAVQNIVRERDHDLEALRERANGKEKELEDLRRAAALNLHSVEALQQELLTTKQDLEDEIQVLVDDAEGTKQEKQSLEQRVAVLEHELKDANETRDKLIAFEKDLRTAERAKSTLEARVSALQSDLKISDQDRVSLQSRIDSLQKDLAAATASPKSTSNSNHEDLLTLVKSAKLESEDLAARLSNKDIEFSDLDRTLRTSLREKDREIRNLEVSLSDLRAELGDKDSELQSYVLKLKSHETKASRSPRTTTEIKEMQSQIRALTAEIETLESELVQRDNQVTSLSSQLKSYNRDFSNKIKAAKAAHDASLEDGTRLREELMGLEKRHASELRGLVRQIGYLRKRNEREEGFRESLGWQKRWFLLTVGMYGVCNKASLNLIAEMGITPDASFRQRRPTLKAVGNVIIATIRMRNMREEWAKCKKVHEGIVKKLESMRRGAARRSFVS